MGDNQDTRDLRPNVRSIAAATGLSVATVSRVLNGSTQVREETRDRVLAAIQSRGYTPNPAARALATSRSRTVGAVIPTLAHSIFARFLNAIELELAEHGYALIIATSSGDPDLELTRARDLLDLGAEGLILSGLDQRSELMDLIAARRTPTVCTSIYSETSALPTIGYDNEQLGREAMDYLQSLGHRHIAVVHGPLRGNDRTKLRLSGIGQAALPMTELAFFETKLDVTGGADVARRLFHPETQPTAVLCASDVLALGVLFETARQGIDVPAAVSVMGFDDLDWSECSDPPLTTIQLPTVDMGRTTARMIVDHLDHGRALASVRLAARIIIRGSTTKVD